MNSKNDNIYIIERCFPRSGGDGGDWKEIANGCRVYLLSNKNILKLIKVMNTQLCK